MSVSVQAATAAQAPGFGGRARWLIVAVSITVGIALGVLMSVLAGGAASSGSTPANQPIPRVQPPGLVRPAIVSGAFTNPAPAIGWSRECGLSLTKAAC